MTNASWDESAPAAPGPEGGRVADLVAYYATQGFEVESRTDREVVLLRINAWPAVILGTVVGAIGTFTNASPRHQRIWLHVDEADHAVVRHHPRRE